MRPARHARRALAAWSADGVVVRGRGAGAAATLLAPRRPASGGGGHGGHGAACQPSPEPAVYPLPRPVQAALNQQIGAELGASLAYLAMATRMAGAAVSLRGAAAMFRAGAEEEREHGAALVGWLVSRGGHFCPRDVAAPSGLTPDEAPVLGSGSTSRTWSVMDAALRQAISMERQVTESLLHVHRVARDCKDVATADFITQMMLSEQMRALYLIGQMHTELQRVQKSNHGLHLFDEMLFQKYKVPSERQNMYAYGLSISFENLPAWS